MSPMAAAPQERMGSAFALSLASGILIVLGSLVVLFTSFIPVVFGIASLVFGTIVLFASIQLYALPRQHVTWGVIILLFACLSVVGFGGFVAGMILGIIGGALGISWRPQRTLYPYGSASAPGAYGGVPIGPYGVPLVPWRMCMGCGRWIPWAYNVCPMCGAQTPYATAHSAVEKPAPPTERPVPPAARPAIFSPEFDRVQRAPPMIASTPPAPAPPSPSPPPPKAACPTCTGEAEWNARAQRWYCPAESRYF